MHTLTGGNSLRQKKTSLTNKTITDHRPTFWNHNKIFQYSYWNLRNPIAIPLKDLESHLNVCNPEWNHAIIVPHISLVIIPSQISYKRKRIVFLYKTYISAFINPLLSISYTLTWIPIIVWPKRRTIK